MVVLDYNVDTNTVSDDYTYSYLYEYTDTNGTTEWLDTEKIQMMQQPTSSIDVSIGNYVVNIDDFKTYLIVTNVNENITIWGINKLELVIKEVNISKLKTAKLAKINTYLLDQYNALDSGFKNVFKSLIFLVYVVGKVDDEAYISYNNPIFKLYLDLYSKVKVPYSIGKYNFSYGNPSTNKYIIDIVLFSLSNLDEKVVTSEFDKLDPVEVFKCIDKYGRAYDTQYSDHTKMDSLIESFYKKYVTQNVPEWETVFCEQFKSDQTLLNTFFEEKFKKIYNDAPKGTSFGGTRKKRPKKHRSLRRNDKAPRKRRSKKMN